MPSKVALRANPRPSPFFDQSIHRGDALGHQTLPRIGKCRRYSATAIERFSATATWLVPVILLAGVTMAVVLLPNVAALREPYGELLIGKVVGFALLMGLAAANKWRLGSGVIRGTVQTGGGFAGR
jgi:hypothetical protein